MGENIIPDGASTDRALKGRLARWEKIQKDPQYTSNESVENAIATEKARIARADAHRVAVQQALAEGKPVPEEVLKDYPDLQKPAPKAEGKVEAAGAILEQKYPEAQIRLLS